MLTDQMERRLIQEEINRQLSFAPMFSFKRVWAKIAALFGSTRNDSNLTEPSTATQ